MTGKQRKKLFNLLQIALTYVNNHHVMPTMDFSRRL